MGDYLGHSYRNPEAQQTSETPAKSAPPKKSESNLGNAFIKELLNGGLKDEPESEAWSDEGLKRRLDYKYEGKENEDLVGSDKLRGVMMTLNEEEPPTDASADEKKAWQQRQMEAALELGAMRGKNSMEAMNEYHKFRHLKSEAAKRAEEEGLHPVHFDMNSEKLRDHMGSTQQLRSGSYVGEVLGVDDVYGALLNPTTGLVGAGAEGVSMNENSVASFHGEAHDAFGYLGQYHDQGPGYSYAAPDKFGKDDWVPQPHLTGQGSGFRKWYDLFDETGRKDPRYNNKETRVRESINYSLREMGKGDLVDPIGDDGMHGSPVGTGGVPVYVPERDGEQLSDFFEDVVGGVNKLGKGLAPKPYVSDKWWVS